MDFSLLFWTGRHESKTISALLSLLKDIWEDVNDPQFIWQVVALIVCLGGALIIASWWRRRHEGGAMGGFSDASDRLAFPAHRHVAGRHRDSGAQIFSACEFAQAGAAITRLNGAGAQRHLRAAPGFSQG
jgi:hypothetical protein